MRFECRRYTDLFIYLFNRTAQRAIASDRRSHNASNYATPEVPVSSQIAQHLAPFAFLPVQPMRFHLSQALPADPAPSLPHHLPHPPQFWRTLPPHRPLLLPARPLQHLPRPPALRQPQHVPQPPPPPFHHHSLQPLQPRPQLQLRLPNRLPRTPATHRTGPDRTPRTAAGRQPAGPTSPRRKAAWP